MVADGGVRGLLPSCESVCRQSSVAVSVACWMMSGVWIREITWRYPVKKGVAFGLQEY